MKKTLIFLPFCLGAFCHHAIAQDWHVAAFGQSTDLNFSSLIEPSKVGRNHVWIAGDDRFLVPQKSYPLPNDFYIESRGGKIANSHDGMTTFYTAIPINQTFKLEADVRLEQIGPEVDGKSPAAQEAAGLFVRDIIGTPRQEPQSLGFEEFPQASNVLMNAFVTQNKKNDNLVQLTSIVRQGVMNSWGNQGITINKTPIVKNINYTETTDLHLAIERTPSQFILTMVNNDTGDKQTWLFDDYAGFMNQQDNQQIFIGFFAARNAKLEVKNAKLAIDEKVLVDDSILADNKLNKQEIKKEIKKESKQPSLSLASPESVTGEATILRFIAEQSGVVTLLETDDTKTVNAGELVEFPVKLNNGANLFTTIYRINDTENRQTTTINVVKSNIANLSEIYVCSTCQDSAAGTLTHPVDLNTAVKFVLPGGKIYLTDGYYKGITLPRMLSGAPDRLKSMIAINQHKAIFVDQTFNLDANYWHLKDVVFDGNIDSTENKPAYIRVSGSHNIIERVIARNNDDTGIGIIAKEKDHLFWPSYNLILNSDSYNNLDLSGINADGFAAKLGVGPGNRFKGCISHNNADDGWDLFNKIEDGPNQPVIIENSVAYANGLPFSKPDVSKGSIGNGFKLGGEGQPVDHKVINSLAFDNNMDGFTDNFNTGSLVIENNVAINNARYNYILRSNPYVMPSSIAFKNNYSVRDQWQDKNSDYLGKQVKSINNHVLTYDEMKAPSNITISRDKSGNIIYPAFLLQLNQSFSYQ